MTRPGVEITIADEASANASPVTSGAAFVVGEADRGRPMRRVRSMAEFVSEYGARDAAANYALYDAVEAIFAEGGDAVYVSRPTASDAVQATVDLDDAGAAPTITVTALGYGAYGNDLTVAVDTDSEGSVLTIADSGTVIEQSPRLPKAGLLAWASNYVAVTDADAAEGEPDTVSATSLATGADGIATIDEDTYEAALALFTSELGVGQVLAPGQTTYAFHAKLLAHAASLNRLALLDGPLAPTSTVAPLASATAIAADANRRYGALFTPGIKVAPVPGTLSQRTVWPSGVMAGINARIGAGYAPAGVSQAVSQHGQGVVATFSDADRATLNEAGVNVVRDLRGRVIPYGIRSTANPNTDGLWKWYPTLRLINEIRAKAEVIAEGYVFAVVDGKRGLFSALQGDLTGMLMDYYSEGLLFGETALEAFAVNVGPTVNTIETIADGCVKADIQVKTSPYGELVQITVVRTPLSTSLAPAAAGSPA